VAVSCALHVVTVELRVHGLGEVEDRDALGPKGIAARLIVSANPFLPVTVIIVPPDAPAAVGPNGFGLAVTVKSTTWTFTVAVLDVNPGDEPVTVTT
jgi:hypothetical protein